MTRLGNVFDRCPKAWLRDDAEIEHALVNDVFLFREYQLVPNAGGTLDQDPRFLEALQIVDQDLRSIQKATGVNG